MKGILGKKVGMTQIFNAQGEVVPITVIEAGPCFVAQIKTEKRDGYNAVQMAFSETKPSRLTKPQTQHLQKAGLGALLFLREGMLLPEPPADGIDVTRLFFFIAPSPRAHLDLLGRLSRLLSRGPVRDMLTEGATDDEIFRAVAGVDADLGASSARAGGA